MTTREVEIFIAKTLDQVSPKTQNRPISDRQAKLFSFIQEQHITQERKFGSEPYINHLIRVAEMADINRAHLYAREIAWGHDLFEDQWKEIPVLEQKAYKLQYHLCVENDYTAKEAKVITDGILGLTDRYTSEQYPTKNRKERKTLEIKRLARISPDVQSIKYCDILDNTRSIVEHDHAFAKLYLKEKAELLTVMNRGNQELLVKCWQEFYNSLVKLNIF